MLHCTRLERLAREKHYSSFGTFITYDEGIVNTGGTLCHNHTLFSLHFTNGPNKLQCYIEQGWKGLPRRNTLAHLAHS
jgi:hypothetical protein